MNTLSTTLLLNMAYRVNHFQYHLRRIPLIKKLFKPSYEASEFKLILTICATVYGLFQTVLFSFLYYLVITMVCIGRASDFDGFDGIRSAGFLWLSVLFIFSLIGILMNSNIAGADFTDYYAICMLRMDARSYLLTQFFVSFLKKALCGGLFSLIVCLIIGLPLYYVPVYMLFIPACKFIGAGIKILLFKKKRIIEGFGRGLIQISLLLLLLAVTVLLMVFNPALPPIILLFAMLAVILLAIPAAVLVIKYPDYRLYFKRFYTTASATSVSSKTSAVETQALQMDLKSAKQTSDKFGFAYMNDIFLLRHHKLLMDTTRLITIAAAVLFVGILVLFFFNRDLADDVAGRTTIVIPYLPFVFYLINRGSNYSAVLFANCDRHMLNYSFFRKRSNILSLFKLRLVGISKQNLLPALVSGLGFIAVECVASVLSGHSELINPANLLVLFIAPIAISIFFSIHYLMLYYLLQPFDSKAQSKSPVYNFALGLTYFVCYMLYQVISKFEGLNSLLVGSIIVAFCILYSLVAVLLVYALAPKTFKNRR